MSIDIKLYNITDLVDTLGYFDIAVADNGDLELEDGFDTNIIMSLFCERRADADEVLEPSLRRGWWGNTLSDTSGFEVGSKLWLLEQSKLTTSTVALAKSYAEQGMQWMKDEGFVYDIIITSTPSYSAGSPGVVLNIDLIRKDNTVEYKYFQVWNRTGN